MTHVVEDGRWAGAQGAAVLTMLLGLTLCFPHVPACTARFPPES